VKITDDMRGDLERVRSGDAIRPVAAWPLIKRGLIAPAGRRYELTVKGQRVVGPSSSD
jgi:hypothetical protein